MFNDISCDKKDNEEECVANAKVVSTRKGPTLANPVLAILIWPILANPIWANSFLAIMVLARPILAKSNFGQSNFGQSISGSGVCHGPKGEAQTQKISGPEVGPEGWGPEGWGPEGWEGRRVGVPKFRAFFFRVPPPVSLFSLSLCVFSWFFGGVWKRRALKCARLEFFLGLLYEAPAAPKNPSPFNPSLPPSPTSTPNLLPAGVSHNSPRAQTWTIEGPGASNTTKIPRKDPKEREKRIKNCGGRVKNARNFGPPTLGAPPFWAPPFFAPPFGPPLFPGLGLHLSGPQSSGRHPPPTRWPKAALA